MQSMFQFQFLGSVLLFPVPVFIPCFLYRMEHHQLGVWVLWFEVAAFNVLMYISKKADSIQLIQLIFKGNSILFLFISTSLI